MDYDLIDNSEEVKRELERQEERALEAIGLMGEGYAKSNLTRFPRVDTGRLRTSVSHKVYKDAAYIGTNVAYAPYVEFGTGPMAEGTGGGRTDVPWFYKSETDGKWHASYGMKASHFLKNAVADHKNEYIRVAESYLKGNR